MVLDFQPMPRQIHQQNIQVAAGPPCTESTAGK
ncbi:uncharacterized protein METZ01_LOCUS359087 [marine metagenome]|uniref:Uncharacterized protein n=1 Tax=marine metagenome TaxID=408172 RepID=A0A382S8K6_9ZZZZ